VIQAELMASFGHSLLISWQAYKKPTVV